MTTKPTRTGNPAHTDAVALARAVFADAVGAVHAGRLVRERTARSLDGDTLTLGGLLVPWPKGRRTHVVTLGKAACPMAAALIECLGSDRLAGGLAITKAGEEFAVPPLAVYVASHPTPDARSVVAAEALLAYCRAVGADDLVLFGISGGGSALACAPAPGLLLADKIAATHLMLAGGLSIQEINTVRKHCSNVKGGRVLQAMPRARVVTLIVSDVLGDPPDMIASGPTVGDPTTYAEALAILERHALCARFPEAVVAHLEAGARGERPETLAPADVDRSRVCKPVVLGNHISVREFAAAAATRRALNVYVVHEPLTGEAAAAAQQLAELLRAIRAGCGPVEPPAAVIATGETVVTIEAGVSRPGGRNRHLALAAVEPLAGLTGVALLAGGTDGGDGTAPGGERVPAGAVVTGATRAAAVALGLEVQSALRACDSHAFFAALDAAHDAVTDERTTAARHAAPGAENRSAEDPGGSLRIGPTATNLLDLAVGIVLAEPIPSSS